MFYSVQPRGLDPKYFGKNVRTRSKDAISISGLKKATESESVSVNNEDEFSFITKFLSSQNFIPNSFVENNLRPGSAPKHKTELNDGMGSAEDTRGYSSFGSATRSGFQSVGSKEDTSPNEMSLDTFMSTFLKTQTSTKSDQKSNQKINDKFLLGNTSLNRTRSRELAPLTPAQDRQLLIPFNPVDEAFVEAKYQSLVQEIPGLIDEARVVIIQEIATKNMLGYTIAGSFVIGAFLDTVGLTLLELDSLSQLINKLISDKFWPGIFIFFWFYAFGYGGPWYFPAIFNAGDPNLKCSSADYFQLLNDYDLTLNIQSFTQLSPAESLILTEKVGRDFYSR